MGKLKDPKREIEYLLSHPVKADDGSIFVNEMYRERPSIQLDLNSYPGRSFGSFYLFSPEEWVRVVEIMRAYFAQENPP